MKKKTMTLNAIFSAVSICLIGAASAYAVPCGLNYDPNVMAIPAGAMPTSFSALPAASAYRLDGSDTFFFATVSTGPLSRMNFHMNEKLYPAQGNEPARAEAKWICADLFPSTPALNASLLYVGGLSPALDGSFFTNYRRFSPKWPDVGGVLTGGINNDAVINPYSAPAQQLTQNWTMHSLYALPNGDLLLLLSKTEAVWSFQMRVMLKKVR